MHKWQIQNLTQISMRPWPEVVWTVMYSPIFLLNPSACSQIKTLSTKVQVSFPGWPLSCTWPIIYSSGRIESLSVTPLGVATCKVVPSFTWTSCLVPFPLADFHLYHFIVINRKCGRYWVCEPFQQTTGSEGDLGGPNTPAKCAALT